ncbi:MAG: S8 family serine peptidase [Eubacterium sp.]
MMNLNWKSFLALVLAASMIPASVPVGAQTTKAAVQRTTQMAETKKDKEKNEKNYAEGEAIILYKKNTSTAKNFSSGSTLEKDIEIKTTYEFGNSRSNSSAKDNSITGGSGVSVSLVTSDKYSTEELIEKLKKRSDIKYAEPNYRIKALDMQDPYKQYQWTLDNKGQNGGTPDLDINADTEALKKSINNQEKVIALVDTGIDYTHEDLENVVWNNPVNSKQLKGEHGYDFINYDGDPLDDNGHGTHCSGIMAATSDNGVGIAGTANSENIKIMALKILDSEGYGYGMEAIGAYNYIYKAQQLGVNVVAVNNSWGAELDEEESESEIFSEVIDMVGKAGALSVCAAGNESNNNDIVEVLPASLDSPYIISVAASNENDELAAFSNYGESVDIAAPGTDVLSTVSYNTFNPVIYDNRDKLCSIYQNFETGNLVQTMEDSKMTGTVAEEGDISYGLDSDSKGKMSVSVDENTYFGVESDGTKSVKWTIEGAKEDGVYTLYLPYVAEMSSTPLYSSLMVKVSGPSGLGQDIFGTDTSLLFVSDNSIDKNGNYNEDSETVLGGAYVDDGNYWRLFTGQVEDSVEESQQRAMSVQIKAGADGDYTVYIDKMGVSKGDVNAEEFGKYDFYNGTSMAAPHITGAVAAVADAFDDKTALERKARILGSVRKSDNLESTVKTGGVLDLSNIENPGISLEKAVLNDKKQIEVQGYYLTGATIKVNGEVKSPIEHTDNKIIIDGNFYINKSIEIEIEKDGTVITGQYFFMNGKKFDKFEGIYGALNGGGAVSDGENLYYADNSGDVYIGTLFYENGINQFDWYDTEQEYTTDMFGDSYKTVVDYTITNESDFVCLNKTLYAILSIDVGYSEDSILAYFDEEKGWKKYADLPADFSSLDGVTLTAYDGNLYIIGGFDEEKGTLSKNVKYLNAAKKTWTQAPALPEGRSFSKALQTGNKLVLTLGANGTYDVPKNLIFDGSKWTISKSDMGEIVEPEMYYYEKDNQMEAFSVAKAQIGLIKDGIVYTDLKVEGLGDTFTYNLSGDKYTSSGYCLDRNSLDGDQLVATTVQDKLYVLYGWGYNEDDWDLGLWKTSSFGYEDLWNSLLDMEGSINVCTMPIQSGYVRVTDNSSMGAYVQGAGYYLPGDTIKLTAQAEEESYVKSFTVNGKKVNADSKGTYTYVAKAQGTTYDIKAAAQAGEYVSEILMEDEVIVLEKSKNSKNTSYQLYLEIFPATADNKKIKWTTSNAKVATVDSNGKVKMASTAKAGQEAVIRATAVDRGTVYGECVVMITDASLSKNSKVKAGNFTYKITSFTSKKKTVTCLSFNKKKAAKATVPATVKINGYKFKVTGISANAFKNGKKLKNVTVGKNITSIGKNAWKGCKKLKKVTIKSSKIKKFGKGLFKGTSKKLTVKVPKKAKNSYSKKLKKAGFKGKVK